MLLYFIIGCVSTIIVLPFLQELSELINIIFEYFRANISVAIVKKQKIAGEILDEKENIESTTQAIGFAIDVEGQENEEDDD